MIDGYEKIFARNTNLVWRFVVPVMAIVVATVAVLAFYLPRTLQQAAIETALQSNLQTAAQIKIIRGYYNESVVAKAKASGALTPTWDHRNVGNGIPLPATFVKDVSGLLANAETSLELISPYPWPHRAERAMDGFQTMAWDRFQSDPDAVVSRLEVIDGRRMLRVAVADRMSAQGCVDCHNADASSPKRDWKIGDVRAVLEVTKTIEPFLTVAENRARMMFLGIVGVAALILAALTGGAMELHRRTREGNEAAGTLHRLAHYDPLTGALKRNSLMEVVSRRLAQRSGDALVALYFIDLDRFKEVNDTLGHAVGDGLLRSVAQRTIDTIGPDALFGRVGGDEFVVAQFEPGGPSAIVTYGGRIVAALAEPVTVDGHVIRISASVGASVERVHDRHGVETLLKEADCALYAAKEAGRDCFRLFDQAMMRQIERRRDIEAAIRRALAGGDGFAFHYQPIYNANTHHIVGFETLLRLRGPDGALVPISEVIAIAEADRSIVEIGARVVRAACAFGAMLPPGLYVSVNLSPAQFAVDLGPQRSIHTVVRDALAATGLEPERLELEITEALFLERSDAVVAELTELKALGVSLAMDDFGRGYSSLGHLWSLPFDKIKIDRSLVQGWSNRESSVGPILETISAMCRTLDLTITAEGIETAVEAAFFTSIGCQQLQGYYFSPPLAEADVAAVILSRKIHSWYDIDWIEVPPHPRHDDEVDAAVA